jgi:hypothetical protein
MLFGHRTTGPVGGADIRADRGLYRRARRLIVVAAGLAMLVLTLLPTATVGAQSGFPPNTVVSTYFDPRYGKISVVTDATGNLIDVNALTGQRIYPDYVAGLPFLTPADASGYLAVAGIPGDFAPAGTPAYVFPPGGTQVGNVIYYNDNRFCGDGKIMDVIGQGYFCQNGGPLVTNGYVPIFDFPYPATNGYVPALTYPNP